MHNRSPVSMQFQVKYASAGLPALQDSQPGQIRKEAATTVAASAGDQARHHTLAEQFSILC